MHVWADWAVSCYVISNPAGKMDLNSDGTAVPWAATVRLSMWPEQNTDLHIHSLVVFLGFLQELLEAAWRHVFSDEYNLCATNRGEKTCSCTSVCVREKEEASWKPYSSLALLHVQPVLVELDNVGVFDLHQVLKHLLDLLLNITHQRWFTSKNVSLSHY